MRRLIALALLAVVVVGTAVARAEGGRVADVQLLADRLRNDHPNLFHDVSAATFDAAVNDLSARAETIGEDEFLVGLMRLAALPGVREGHTGIFPLDPTNSRVLHEFPIRLYEFSDGMYVIGQVGGRDLLRARLVAVNGRPLADVEALLRPLVPHDNDSSLRQQLTQYLTTAEVLHGLGIASSAGPLPFTFERDGARLDVVLTPIAAPAYNSALGSAVPPLIGQAITGRVPAYVARRSRDQWSTMLASRRVFYLGYNEMSRETWSLSRQVLKAAKKKRLRGVIVDLRNDGGGDNHTYVDLLNALARISKTKRVVAIISRTTFSAAENFVTELERRAHPIFVGEPSGGSPNLYGDVEPISLPASGVTAEIATVYWQKSTPNDPRITTDPQVPVPLSSVDFFAGRDPVLSAALKTALG
jgi:Peptidase family S41